MSSALEAFVQEELERRMRIAEAWWDHFRESPGYQPSLSHEQYLFDVIAMMGPICFVSGPYDADIVAMYGVLSSARH